MINESYETFLKNNNKFFNLPESQHFKKEFETDLTIIDCQISTNHLFWRQYSFGKVPKQGFKIHISTAYHDAKQTLFIVSSLMKAYKINFKHVLDGQALFWMYSKNGSRLSVGKFITIYPTSTEQFLFLLDLLHESLLDSPEGPYILTDARYKESNVYYRYGAFKEMINAEGIHCIQNDQGQLVPDMRKPNTPIPDFIKIPEVLNETLTPKHPQSISKLAEYEIKKALKFSNSGGIYHTIRKRDGKEYVIKEARPHVGYDLNGSDATQRLHHEYLALKELKHINHVVKVYDYFEVSNHHFLVLEHASGLTLNRWLDQHYPIFCEENYASYLLSIKSIYKKLYECTSNIHAAGIAVCDISPANIIVHENLDITLIDFETAQSVSSKKTNMQTPGFSHKENIISVDKDYFGLSRILHYLIFPLGSNLANIDTNINKNHSLWIHQTFGSDFYHFFYHSQMSFHNKLSTFKKLFSNAYISPKSSIFTTYFDPKHTHSSLLSTLTDYLSSTLQNTSTSNNTLGYLNGISGMLLAIYRSGNFNKDTKASFDAFTKHLDFTSLGDDFNNGKAGILLTMYELECCKLSLSLAKEFTRSYDITTKNISFGSGLSGIGLTFISLYSETNDDLFLIHAKKIASKIISLIELSRLQEKNNRVPESFDILQGNLGVILFLLALFKITNEQILLDFSFDLFQKEYTLLKKYELACESKRSLATLESIKFWFKFISKILQLTTSLSCPRLDYDLKTPRLHMNVSLFSGLGAPIIFTTENVKFESLLKCIDNFIIEKNNKSYLSSGQFNNPLLDIETGNAGLLLALSARKQQNPLAVFPLIHKLFHSF